LTVGNRRRDVVHDQLDAADAETRPRPESARADLQILRIVLAVLDHEARHARQRFGEIDQRLSEPQVRALDHVDGGRRILRARGLPRGGDNQYFDGRFRLRGGSCRRRESCHRKGESQERRQGAHE
jgi:hypothetical protein